MKIFQTILDVGQKYPDKLMGSKFTIQIVDNLNNGIFLDTFHQFMKLNENTSKNLNICFEYIGIKPNTRTLLEMGNCFENYGLIITD